MEQFDEVKRLIEKIEEYLRTGKISCLQVPIEDIILFVAEEYNSVALESEEALTLYRELLTECINEDNAKKMSAVIRVILNENKLIGELYKEKIGQFDFGNETIPYKVELAYYKNKERNREKKSADSPQGHRKVFVGRGVVYSAVFGGYDPVRPPEYVDDRLDYVLFTDRTDLESDIWKIVVVDNPLGLDTTRQARRIKIIGGYEYLNEYDFTIWTDGKLQIIGDLFEYIEKYSLDAPILCFNHFVSDDIYEEAKSCIILDRDDPHVINAQISRYREEGFPEKSGLIDSCMLVRDNRDPELKNAMYAWWNEVVNGSKRDQLSFNYVCWKNQISYDSSPLISYLNPYIKTYGHGSQK